ncbi:hypothetical protein EGH25_01905 [Haladaptatus sp. F3-133]|uniref:Uncharacterized protein n=1 Tax=Halorutilus salinus TaxID=2487751 RepID=A0A9Q4C440_9EURY|nr:hypothetical protein [Halorutilus salinus]MCX2818109.1 hypothetical protein [Halorutilus salinus]
MSDEKPLITLRLGEEKQDRWDEYIQDNGEVNNRSELIRRSVSYYMNRDRERDVQLIDVLEEMKEMRQDVRLAKQSIENVESRQLTFEDVVAASEEAEAGDIDQIESMIEEVQDSAGLGDTDG